MIKPKAAIKVQITNFIFIFSERRTVQGFMKVYEPARIRSDDDNEEEGEEYDFRHIAKETHIPNQTVSTYQLQEVSKFISA